MVAVYLDTSAVLRAVLEDGPAEDLERSIADAPVLVTSRLSPVEAARAFHRLRLSGGVPVAGLAAAERSVEQLWLRCELWELDRLVCDLALAICPRYGLRTLDALHLATFFLARRELGDVELLTADERMRDAASEPGHGFSPS